MKDIKYEIAARRSGGDPAVLVASCEKAKKSFRMDPKKSGIRENYLRCLEMA